jgi:hypothetical protein
LDRNPVLDDCALRQGNHIGDRLIKINTLVSWRGFLNVIPDTVEDISRSIGIINNVGERFPGLAKIWWASFKEVHGYTGIVARGSNRLRDFVSQRGGQLSHHTQAVRPKSTRLEVFRTSLQDAKVIGSYLKENDGVYLWLLLPDSDEPRYYKLPWDKKVAKELQDAIAENESQHGGGIGMGLPFERSWDREEPKFYALPQPKLPDKPGETPPVTVYKGPEQAI